MHIHFYATELRKASGYETETEKGNPFTFEAKEEISNMSNDIPDLDFEDMEGKSSTEKEEDMVEISQNQNNVKTHKDILISDADDKLEYQNILRILMQDKDTDRIKRNLAIIRTCELSNFLPSVSFKKRKLEKQPDFLPKCRKLEKEASCKLYDCLMPSSKITIKSKLSVTDNLVNDFLQMLCGNFSSEIFKIAFKSTIESQLIMTKNKKYEQEQNDLIILPFSDGDCWRVKIDRLNLEGQIFYPDCEDWLTGYSMLLKVLQELTNQKMPHTNQVLDRFRTFLQELFLLNADPLDYCYKCFKLLAKYKLCEECPLRFCENCLLSTKCPRH